MAKKPPLFKCLTTDAGGYGLIVLGIALGWLPGPGGIPLVIAGLGLLSINNPWASRLRDYLLRRGGRSWSNSFLSARPRKCSTIFLVL